MHSLDQLQRGELRGITRLDLSAELDYFPEAIYDLADSLEILNLSGNALTHLPDDLPRLHKLRVIFCSDNRFTTLPPVLGQCPRLEMVGFKANQIEHVPSAALPARLRWLILTDNAITQLPDQLGDCERLQKLMLSGNRLTTLPARLARCQRLELLRIAANQLNALPDELLSLPRLSWLAYAGNPFSDSVETQLNRRHPIRDIPWSELHLQERLGEGASGIIHRALWQAPGAAPLPVAVKSFKGAVTSDGLPHSEMSACLSAGAHPDLIPVLGRIADHPEGSAGLVLGLIDPHFKNLAGPPSLESCTRDIYAEAATYLPRQALRLAAGIARAAAHLHRQGILHGDLYAHNILHCDAGNPILGDFGAACFYEPESPQAQALEGIEVRAFGCLLEELAERSNLPAPLASAWREMQRGCMLDVPTQRPRFAELDATLSGLLDAL